MAATGLAAHAIFPGLSVAQWGVTHSLLALLLAAPPLMNAAGEAH